MDEARAAPKGTGPTLHLRWRVLAASFAVVLIGLPAAKPAHAASMTYEYDLRGNVSRIQQFGSSATVLAVNAFSPNMGSPGAEVQIEGQGFNPSPSGNIVQFNGIAAPVLWASQTRLLASVPMQATTGPISVTAGGITAQSDQPFIVTQLSRPPVITSLNPSRGPIGTVVQVLGNNLNPYPGQTVVQLNGLYVAPTFINDIQLIFTVPPYVGSGPVSASTAFGVASASTPFIVTPLGVLPASLRPPLELAPGGSPVQASFNAADQWAVFHFSGEIDDLVTLRLGQLTAGAGSLPYTLYDPTNAVVSNGSLSAIATGLHPPRLTKKGTYALMVSGGSGIESFTVRMEKSLWLMPGALPVDFSQEQSRRIAIQGTAGQNLGLGITNLVKINGSSSGSVRLSVTSPSGSSLATVTCASPACDVNLLNLPATGVYGVLLTSSNWNQEPNMAMSFTAILSEEVTATLAPGVVENSIITRQGQNGRFSFQGTAGATLGLTIADIATTPASGILNFTVLKPDGSAWKTGSAAQGDGFTFNLANLPATGTYQLLVDPVGGRTASFKIRLVSASQAEVVAGGAAYLHPTTFAGETGFFTFQATAGQNLGLGLHDIVRTGGYYSYVRVTVYKPDGTVLTTFNCNLPACDANLLSLPATGTYSVSLASARWDLEPNWTVSFAATLSEEVTATLSAGTVESAGITRQGQNGRFSFPGTAGTTLGLAIADIVTTPAGGSLNFTVLKPDGSAWKTGSAAQGDGFTFNLANLPATGTYQLLVDPVGGRTASFKIRLVSASQAEVVTGDGAYLHPATLAGETAFFSFQATAGQNLGLGLHDIVRTGGYYGYVKVTVYKPDGASLTTLSCHLPACDFDLQNLPATGTYVVQVASARWDLEPNWTISFTATLSEEITATLVPGVTQSIDLARNGQDGRFSFSGTAGATMGVSVADIATTPTGALLNLTVYKPDGGILKSATTPVGGGHTFSLQNLPATGTYQLLVDPASGRPATFKVTALSSSQVLLTTGGTPFNQPTTLRGESRFLAFSASSGQNLTLGIGSLVKNSGYYSHLSVQVYKPDGTVHKTASCSAPGCSITLPSVPAAGMYTVILNSPRWELEPNMTMSYSASLSSP